MMELKQIINELRNYEGPDIKIMEVCGTHTSSIFKNGIRSLISPGIELISGPGCPVCVTSSVYIDQLVMYSLKEDHCVLTFGDMMKVRGSKHSLISAQALGGKVQMIYSPLTALQIAAESPQTQFVVAAVGFETTIPIYALLLDEMERSKIRNLRLFTSLKTMIPVLSFICEQKNDIDAFLCPGHVSVITGSHVFLELAEKYHKPFVITGFEGEHILASIYEIIQQLKHTKSYMTNLYQSVVSRNGNEKAREFIRRYFVKSDEVWRGIGLLTESGLRIRPEYQRYDAKDPSEKLPEEPSEKPIERQEEKMPAGCCCRDVILGRVHPIDCPLFANVCTPFQAVGPCMVSNEGACKIWYVNREE